MPKIIKIREIGPKFRELKDNGKGINDKNNKNKSKSSSDESELEEELENANSDISNENSSFSQSQSSTTPFQSSSRRASVVLQSQQELSSPSRQAENLERALPVQFQTETAQGGENRENANAGPPERIAYQGRERNVYAAMTARPNQEIYESTARQRTQAPERRVIARQISSPTLGGTFTRRAVTQRDATAMLPMGEEPAALEDRERSLYEESDLQKKRKDKWQF